VELLVGVVLLWLVLGGALVSVLALLRKFIVEEPKAGAKKSAGSSARKAGTATSP
jgi:Flp pilus assembly protein TadB